MAHETARERIEEVMRALEGELPLDHKADLAAMTAPDPVSNTSPERYSEMVDIAKEYVKAGDIFQVVLSQRFDAPFSLPPFSLYRALRRVNPAPFLCYLDFEAFQIVCSSPEILVRLREGKSRSGLSPARAGAAPRPPKMKRWRRSCWKIPRSAPST